jgi:hypothetical protein
MARTIPEYFAERREECRKLSLADASPPRYLVEAGSEEKRGRIILSLHMTARASMAVSESIHIDDEKGLHRVEYAYYLLIDGQEYWARDLDPIHGYHGHTIGHKRTEAERISFKKAVEEAWEIVSQEEELEEASPPSDSY